MKSLVLVRSAGAGGDIRAGEAERDDKSGKQDCSIHGYPDQISRDCRWL
jgi:hypothetical protein